MKNRVGWGRNQFRCYRALSARSRLDKARRKTPDLRESLDMASPAESYSLMKDTQGLER